MTAMSLALFAESAATGLRSNLRLVDLPETWAVVLLVLPAFALVTWIGYRREALSLPVRLLLAGLRMGAFLLLFAVLSRPVHVLHREEVHPAEVLVLVDDSASMQRKDSYTGDPETQALVRDLAGSEPFRTTRTELAVKVLRSHLLPQLEELGYEPRLFAFAEDARPLANTESLSKLKGRGSATHVGDSLGGALTAQRGRNLAAVILVSDGRSNGGLPVLDAGRAAGAASIPVHTIVIGDTRPERNAVIELVEAPASILEGEDLAVTVRVTGRGTGPDRAAADGSRPGETADIVLEELFEGSQAPRPLAEEQAALGEAGTRVVLEASAAGADTRTGQRRFRVSVAPIPGETLLDDNAVEFSVQVSSAKVRVLYVDGYPRWEYRFLKELLKRKDANIEVQAFLLSATSDFVQESSRGLESLQRVPTSRRELLERYDVIVLGDMDPRTVSPDPELGAEFTESVRAFVAAGGGLMLQAGEFDNPRSLAGTPLEELLPVVLDAAGALPRTPDSNQPFRPVLETPASPHEVVRLHPDLASNRRLWEDESGLAGLYWYSQVPRAKPGADVLLRHPTEYNDHGRFPLLVAGHYPQGRVLWLGVDETWRWRWKFGPKYRERFWRNAIHWLAIGRLKSGDRRYRLETGRSAYDLGQRVVIEARVLDDDFQPAEKSAQPVRVEGPSGRVTDLDLTPVAGRPGLYRASLDPERPGLWRAWIEADGLRTTSVEFEVQLSSREGANPAPDPEVLAALSSMTGGRSVHIGRAGELLSEFPGGEERREPISSKLEDAWDRWGTLLLALALLSSEWILRKRMELL